MARAERQPVLRVVKARIERLLINDVGRGRVDCGFTCRCGQALEKRTWAREAGD